MRIFLKKIIFLTLLQAKYQSCVKIFRPGSEQPTNMFEIVRIGTNIEGLENNLEIHESYLEAPALISWSKMCNSPELGLYSWGTSNSTTDKVS